MRREKVRGAVVGVMYFVSLLCIACAVCVLLVCFGDAQGSLERRHAGLDESEKGGLALAYALASAAIALWIGTWRMLRDSSQAPSNTPDEESSAL